MARIQHRSHRSWVAVCLSAVLVISACGGGGGGSAGGGGGASAGGDVPVGPVVVGLQPSVDGWSFPNFPSSSFPEVNFAAADVVSMFGSDETICVGGVADPCELTAEAAAWARMVNQARASGHCEGLVVLASSRFNNKETPETVKLPTVEETLGAIMRAFATQFIPEVQESIGKWMSVSLADKVAELKRSLATGKLEYTLGVYVAEGGHAVLPYAVEYPSPDVARIMIYDSNWPAKNRYVDVDLKAETWRFSFAGEDPEADAAPWTGGPADMDLTPFSAREGTCPFCGKDVKVAKTTLLIRSANLEWSVESGDQVITPETGVSGDGASAQPVKGMSITSSQPQSGGGRSSYDYMLQIPNELLDEFLGSQESTTTSAAATGGGVNLNFSGPSSVFAMTPSGIAEVKTEGKSNEPINVTRNSIKTKDPSANVTLASGNLVANASGSQVELQTSDTGMQVTVTAPNGQVITQDVTPDQPVVQMVADPNSGGITVLAQDSTGTVQQTNVAPDGTQTTQTVDPGALNLNSTAVELPAGLESKPIESLPPLENRNLANPDYKPDTPYVAPTTIAPRAESGGQVAGGASTTVAGRAASSTTVAGRGVNSASNNTTAATDDPVRPKIGSFTIPAKTFGDDPFTLGPPDSDSSGGFRFTSSRPEVATVALLTGRVTIVGAGSTTITATQSAVKGFTTASVTATLTVAKARPEITKPAALSRTFGDEAFTLRAPSSTSGGVFGFDSSDEKVARVNKTSGRVTITGAGRTTITLSQAATDDHLAGSTDVVLTVRKATPELTVAASEIAKTFGDADFDLSAPSSVSKGAFSFTSSNTNVVSVTSAGRASIKGVGTATVTVSQAATDDHLAASTTVTVRVSRAGAGLSGFADVTKVFGDAKFTLPTPKSNGSGAFTYASDNDKVATINASSGEVTVVGAGSATITATQAESANHAGGVITAKITVDKAAPSITKFDPAGVKFGDEFTLAPESASTGAFTFSTDKAAIFEVNATTGRVKALDVGTATLTVRQAASANYEAASRSVTVTVGKATPTIGTFSLPAMSYLDVVTPTAPTSNSTGVFTYSSGNSNVVRVTSAGTLVADGVGQVTITATQAETTRYTSGGVTATITVDKLAPTLSNFVIPTKAVGDAAFQLTPPTSTRTPASFTYAVVQNSDPGAPVALSNVATVSSTGLVTIVGSGTATIRATQDGNSLYTAATIDATFTVNRSTPVLSGFGGGTPGLLGKRYSGYFGDNPNWFATATLHGDTETSQSIDRFSSSPDFGSQNNYSWEWTGVFRSSVAGSYEFCTASDDASYLWLGSSALSGMTVGNALVNNGGAHAVEERCGTTTLLANTNYDLRIQFGELSGGDEITVSFAPPNSAKTTDGTGFFFTSGSMSKSLGDAPFTPGLPTSPSSGAIAFSSSDTSVATIHPTSGLVTINGTGSTTLTATQAATDNYTSASTTVLLTVVAGTNPVATGMVSHLDAQNAASVGTPGVWSDLSGNEKNATLVNVTRNGSGYMEFNGTNSYGDWGQPLEAGSNYTIEAWVWRNTSVGPRNIVSTKQSPFWFNDATLNGGIANAFTATSVVDSTTNAWIHVAVTFDDTANTMVLYRDGIEVNRNSNVTVSFPKEWMTIGSHNNGSNAVSFFNGRIAQIRLYDRALSGAEISHNRSVTLVS